jgi:hypothetical protein
VSGGQPGSSPRYEDSRLDEVGDDSGGRIRPAFARTYFLDQTASNDFEEEWAGGRFWPARPEYPARFGRLKWLILEDRPGALI